MRLSGRTRRKIRQAINTRIILSKLDQFPEDVQADVARVLLDATTAQRKKNQAAIKNGLQPPAGQSPAPPSPQGNKLPNTPAMQQAAAMMNHLLKKNLNPKNPPVLPLNQWNLLREVQRLTKTAKTDAKRVVTLDKLIMTPLYQRQVEEKGNQVLVVMAIQAAAQLLALKGLMAYAPAKTAEHFDAFAIPKKSQPVVAAIIKAGPEKRKATQQ